MRRERTKEIRRESGIRKTGMQEKSEEIWNSGIQENQNQVWNAGNQELGELFLFPGFVVSRLIFLSLSPVFLIKISRRSAQQSSSSLLLSRALL